MRYLVFFLKWSLLTPDLMLRRLLDHVRKRIRTKPGKDLRSKFRSLDETGTNEVNAALLEHYFVTLPDGYLASDEGRKDLEAHLRGRLQQDREIVIPWLNRARPLDGSTILEVGCGTGCSTVALAEQGASVTAVDLSERSLSVAQTRCNAYGLRVDFHQANIVDALPTWSGRRFDFVIFYASLEHMTHDERITAIRDSWQLLGRDSLWCVIETPNRLWYYDGHTSLLPFFLWLPDQLAFEYSRFSPRPSFASVSCDSSEEQQLKFLRQGRGVSYHEFELALERSVLDLAVVSSLVLHNPYIEWLRRWRWPRPLEWRYSRILEEIYPQIHRGFLLPNLDLILRREPPDNRP